MKYFIGAPIPNLYKNKVETLRAEFRFLTTEPHITIVPPPALPDDDSFITDLIEVCKNTEPFKIKLDKLGQFGNRVLYVNVYSKELVSLYDNIFEKLNLVKEKRDYTPHLTIVKQRPKRPVDIEAVKKRAEIKLTSYPEYTLNSVVVYHQPKEKFIYVPYMEIPLSIDKQLMGN
ncbi:MAG TPA: hypothetical protein DHU59_05880 [Clostridiales bacterium]|nr:hypothetical protein [Clostridiales bacterium]